MAAITATTAAVIAASAAAASTVVSAAGAYMQAEGQKSQLKYQAAVARNNKIIADQDAAAIRERGEVAEAEHRRRISQTIGSARSSQAANGFLVDGDAGDANSQLVGDLAAAGELDILNMRDRTELAVRNKNIEGLGFQANAGLLSGQASQISPAFNAGTTLLQGAAQHSGTIVAGFG